MEVPVAWGVSVKGSGRVIKKTTSILSFDFDFPKQGWLVVSIPHTRGVITIEYKQDGCGNFGAISIGALKLSDNNIRITPNLQRNRVRIDPSVSADEEDLEFTLRKVSSERAQISEIAGIEMLEGRRVELTKA